MISAIVRLLSETPAQAWATIIGVIIGSLMTMIGVWLNNRAGLHRLSLQLDHEAKLHTSRARRERLEELYVQVGNWFNAMFSHQLSLTQVMRGKMTFEEHFEMMSKANEKVRHDYSRIEMIINIYGADFKDTFDIVISARSSLNQIDIAHDHARKRGESGDQFVKPYIASQRAFEAVGEELKAAIASAARAA